MGERVMVEIPFHLIRVNIRNGKLEIVFPYGNDWYRCDWDNVPERFKHLYVVWLKLQGKKIPEHLKEYEVETVSVKSTKIRIDLDKCERVTETYPLV